MKPRRHPPFAAAAALLALACVGATAVRAQSGGGDVVFVPTPPEAVEVMLGLARVGPGDMLIDLGSGDGRLVIGAAKKGARALGVDLDPELIRVARDNAAKAGMSERAKFAERNLFEQDLTRASVVTLYLLPELNLKLRPLLLAQLKPGARVVTHDFHMGDWFPDRTLTVEAPGKTVGTAGVSQVYLWIVPAPVAGRWQVSMGGREQAAELTIVQRYQHIGGTWKEGGATHTLTNARLSGDRIEFDVPAQEGGKPRHFSGRVAGEGITGAMGAAGARDSSAAQRWGAMRVAKSMEKK